MYLKKGERETTNLLLLPSTVNVGRSMCVVVVVVMLLVVDHQRDVIVIVDVVVVVVVVTVAVAFVISFVVITVFGEGPSNLQV
jgi:hypothetical protein